MEKNGYELLSQKLNELTTRISDLEAAGRTDDAAWSKQLLEELYVETPETECARLQSKVSDLKGRIAHLESSGRSEDSTWSRQLLEVLQEEQDRKCPKPAENCDGLKGRIDELRRRIEKFAGSGRKTDAFWSQQLLQEIESRYVEECGEAAVEAILQQTGCDEKDKTSSSAGESSGQESSGSGSSSSAKPCKMEEKKEPPCKMESHREKPCEEEESSSAGESSGAESSGGGSSSLSGSESMADKAMRHRKRCGCMHKCKCSGTPTPTPTPTPTTTPGASCCYYTNASPTTATVGGIPAGTTFSNTPLSTILGELFYPYLAPAFTSFSIQGQSSTLEVGQSITGSQVFDWATSNSANVATNSVSITDVTGSTTLASGLANTGSHTASVGTVANDSSATYVWGISATNTKSQTLSDTFSVSWEYRVYWGKSGSTTLTGTEVAALTDTALQSGFAGTYDTAAGGYKYFAFPDVFGSPAQFKDTSTNFLIAMADTTSDASYSNEANGYFYALVSVTNAHAVTTNYRVYRTYNTLGGSLDAQVS